MTMNADHFHTHDSSSGAPVYKVFRGTKYNEKAERFAPRLVVQRHPSGLCNLPPSVAMESCEDGAWVHYVKFCEAIRKQKARHFRDLAEICKNKRIIYSIYCDQIGSSLVPDYRLYKRYKNRVKWCNKWIDRCLKIATNLMEE